MIVQGGQPPSDSVVRRARGDLMLLKKVVRLWRSLWRWVELGPNLSQHVGASADWGGGFVKLPRLIPTNLNSNIHCHVRKDNEIPKQG